MMGWIFAGVTVGAVLMATFSQQTRHAILALWVAGLGIGAMYLTIGAEFLAIIQWIVSTLVAISFIFFAVMFGEYHSSSSSQLSRNQMILMGLSIVLGATFAGIVWYGTQGLQDSVSTVSPVGSDLNVIGKILTHDNLLSLEVLAVILFLVLVGGGVVARSEGGDQS